MATKELPKVDAPGKVRALFQAAVKDRDLAAVRNLIAAGHKPDAAAAREAARACNKAFSTANRTGAPLELKKTRRFFFWWD